MGSRSLNRSLGVFLSILTLYLSRAIRITLVLIDYYFTIELLLEISKGLFSFIVKYI